MYNVGLTGNIAAGKTAVSTLFRDWGAEIIDADAIVRDLQQPGTPVYQAIVTRFGPDVTTADHTLNRAALRHRVLADPAERKALEAIVHPAVESERRRRIAAATSRDGIIVSDIPLLFEAMDPERFDAVVLVDAPEPVRRARLLTGRGLDGDEVDALLRAQMPATSKRAGSDFVVDNDATRDVLRERAWIVWRKLLSRARTRA